MNNPCCNIVLSFQNKTGLFVFSAVVEATPIHKQPVQKQWKIKNALIRLTTSTYILYHRFSDFNLKVLDYNSKIINILTL